VVVKPLIPYGPLLVSALQIYDGDPLTIALLPATIALSIQSPRASSGGPSPASPRATTLTTVLHPCRDVTSADGSRVSSTSTVGWFSDHFEKR
jgi:hypothetical protein